VGVESEGSGVFRICSTEVIAQQVWRRRGQGSGGNVSSIDGLEWRLRRRFEQSRIFSDHENLDLKDLFRPGQCTILQLSDIDETEQQVIVGALLRRTNKARMATVRGNAREGEDDSICPIRSSYCSRSPTATPRPGRRSSRPTF
jgi:hypothetical protein